MLRLFYSSDRSPGHILLVFTSFVRRLLDDIDVRWSCKSINSVRWWLQPIWLFWKTSASVLINGFLVSIYPAMTFDRLGIEKNAENVIMRVEYRVARDSLLIHEAAKRYPLRKNVLTPLQHLVPMILSER